MLSNHDLKKYRKKENYSYTFGMFPTFELLNKKPEKVVKILLHSTISEEVRKKVIQLCLKNNIEYVENNKLVEKIREKESCLLIGVFFKYQEEIQENANHVVLVNPSDSGNVGTIIRTAVGFGIHDIAIIEPAVDIFNPKTIRASMGSIFSTHIQLFSSFLEYQKAYESGRNLYPFLLKAKTKLGEVSRSKNYFSLIFGNEASGLDDTFLKIGQSVIIPHSKEIDSLNLSLAAGIAIYEFTKNDFMKNRE